MSAFFLDDSSPAIHYFPFADTYSLPNLTAGWNPYFNLSGFASAPGEEGNGTSFHVTSLNNASLSIQWTGTAIQLLGNATLSSFDYILDGVSFHQRSKVAEDVLLSIDNLANTPHTLALVTQTTDTQTDPPQSLLFFDGAIITAPPITGSNSSLQTLNDSHITFHGAWSHPSFHSSSAPEDNATFKFTGSSLFIRGTTSPSAGNFSVSLDGKVTFLNARSSFTQINELLYFATGLDSTAPHDVIITNVDGSVLVLESGGVTALSEGDPSVIPTSSTPLPSATSSTTPTSPPLASGSTNFPTGTIAALVLAGILAFILISGILFYFLFYRPQQLLKRQQRMERRRVEARAKKERELLDAVGPVGADRKDGDRDFLDIPPVASTTAAPRKTRSKAKGKGKRKNGSGFMTWQQESQGLGGGGLGPLSLAFRHSDSIREKRRSRSRSWSGVGGGHHFNGSGGNMGGGVGGNFGVGGGEKDEDVEEYEVDFPDDVERQGGFGYAGAYGQQQQQSERSGAGNGNGGNGNGKGTWWSRHRWSYSSRSSTGNVEIPPVHVARHTRGGSGSGGTGEMDMDISSSPSGAGIPRDASSGGLSYMSTPPLRGSGSGSEPSSLVGLGAGGVGDVTTARAQVGMRRPALLIHPLAATSAREQVEDRGSVREDLDEGASVLGPASAQAAIRSLSPRTSEVSRSVSSAGASPQDLHPQGQTRVEGRDERRGARLSGLSHVRFEDEDDGDEEGYGAGSALPPPPGYRVHDVGPVPFPRYGTSTPAHQSPAEETSRVQLPVPPRRKSFLDFGSGAGGGGASSDMASSGDTSSNSRSRDATSTSASGDSMGGSGSGDGGVSARLRSRWSSTTGPSMVHTTEGSGESSLDQPAQVREQGEVQPPLVVPGLSQRREEGSASGSASESNGFPFPVSIPASSPSRHPHQHQQQQHEQQQPASSSSSSPPAVASRTQPIVNVVGDPPDLHRVHTHPVGDFRSHNIVMGPGSPTESVPLSVQSDLQFRHSDSEEQEVEVEVDEDSEPPAFSHLDPSAHAHLRPAGLVLASRSRSSHPPLPAAFLAPAQSGTFESVSTPTWVARRVQGLSSTSAAAAASSGSLHVRTESAPVSATSTLGSSPDTPRPGTHQRYGSASRGAPPRREPR